jgi:hypothetical protein
VRAGIEFAQPGVFVKEVNAMKIMVRDNPFMSPANSLLYQVVHFEH